MSEEKDKDNNAIDGSIDRMSEGFNKLSMESYRQRLSVAGFIWAAAGIISGAVLSGVGGSLPPSAYHMAICSFVAASVGIVTQLWALECGRYVYKKLKLYGEADIRLIQKKEWTEKLQLAMNIGSDAAHAIAKDVLWVINNDEADCYNAKKTSFRFLYTVQRFCDVVGLVSITVAILMMVLALIAGR